MPSGRQPAPLSKGDMPAAELRELADLMDGYVTEYNRYVESRRREVQLVGYRKNANPTMDDIEDMRFELMDSYRNLQKLSATILENWKAAKSTMTTFKQRKLFK